MEICDITKPTMTVWKYDFAKNRLKEIGRTRPWLAGKIGISMSSMNKYLSGAIPNPPVMKLMAQFLECQESDLWEDGPPTAKAN